ncbi:MAG: hypothetical protein AB2L24_02350 [Mangrovibacterium sp.]
MIKDIVKAIHQQITWDREEIIEKNGSKIQLIPVYKWLMTIL